MNDRATHLPDPAASPPLAGQPDAALPVGMRLGAFEIQRVISRSASAVVYLATDHALSMPVAIQEYLPARLVRRDAGLRLIAAAEWHDALIDRGLRAFVDEARMLARCEHSSLVRVLQLFHSHGSAYRVMPVYAGQRLSDLCREMESAPDEAAMRALLDGLLGAIEAIHRSGQVHGGVSADNILLLADDRPLLLGPGAAAREIGSDLVESLMATLESPPDATRATEAEAGTPPTGAALDLYQLAAVMRFCIAGEQPVSPQALRLREPLSRVIARGLPSETRQPYSAALLGALDAAVSPFAEDRPLSAAQFRDWLARGVPAVPGRGSTRVTAPAAAPPMPAPVPVSAPAVAAAPPAPEPARRRGPVAPHADETEPSFDPETTAEANAPLAPWPDVVRAIDPPPAAFADPAPAPPPLPRLTRSRQRRYKWLMGCALALLAAVVLAIATGAWNLAPEIPLGPQVDRTDSAPPAPAPTPAAATGRDTVAAETPAEPRPTAEVPVDPTRTLAQAPSAAGPTPPAAASVAAAPVEPAAAATEPPPPGARPAAPPAARPAPRSPPPRAVAAATPAAAPRTACAGRTEFALYRCMQQQCQAKRFSAHPQCVRLRLDDRVD